MYLQTKIVLNRQSDLILDNAEITSPVGIVLADIAGATDAISAEESLRVAAVAAEESARISGDANLQNQIDNVLSNVDPESLDSLTEIVAAFQSADGDLNGAITTLADAAGANLSAEVSNRIADVDEEQARAEYAEAQLSAELSSGLSFEVSVRIADVDEEQARAEYAEGVLTADLSSEVTNRGTAVTAEASYRVAGDLSLQNQIDFISNNTDAAAIDSLTEIVAAFQSADGDINNAITTLADAAGANLSTEVARATSAEALLTADLSNEVSARIADVDAEESRAMSAEAVLTADLSSEVAARGTAVDAEESSRLAADASIAAELSSDIEALADVDGTTIVLNAGTNQIELADEVAAGTGGIRTLMGEIDIETILKVDGVDVMAEISSEIARAEAAEASIAEELSTEVSYLIANTDLGSIDSFAEVVADLSSEVTRAESAELSLANTYFRKATYSGEMDGSNDEFQIDQTILAGSEAIYLNGLLMDGGDYSLVEGNITFNNPPQSDDKVVVYGVYFYYDYFYGDFS